MIPDLLFKFAKSTFEILSTNRMNLLFSSNSVRSIKGRPIEEYGPICIGPSENKSDFRLSQLNEVAPYHSFGQKMVLPHQSQYLKMKFIHLKIKINIMYRPKSVKIITPI